MEKILKEQIEKSNLIHQTYDEGTYTIDQPLIMINPYGVCPLSGVMLFHMEQRAEGFIEIEGIRGVIQLIEGKNEVPILGLKPGCNNVICIQINLEEGLKCYTFQVQTQPLSEDYPNIQVKVSQQKKMAEGLIGLCLGKSQGVKTTVALYSIIDASGEVRWFYTPMAAHVFKQLENGHVIVDAPVSSGICGAYTSAGFIEMDLIGRIVSYYPIPNGLHHDVYELPNGNFLAITQREHTKQDLLVEIDRKTKSVIKEWDFRELLDPNRQTVIDKVSVNHPLDWLHLNAVVYDEKDDAIIVTSRNQSCAVKFNKTTSQIQWIIAPHEGWDEPLLKYVLQPQDSSIISWAPHTPVVGKNGELFLFDNGNFRSYDLDKAIYAYENYSRAIAYQIDLETHTYKKVWSYGEERGNKTYCPYLGAIRVLDNGNCLICFGGITKDIFGAPTDDMKSDRMKNQVTIVEVTGDKKKEVVFEISMRNDNIQTAEGYKCYRSERIFFYNK